jgi:dTDP-4-dehydrorhamnose 3,5-epimerase
MKVTPTTLPGVLILEPTVIADARGSFLESFNQREFDRAIGAQTTFVQDNHSFSTRGVLRGLHMQAEPHGQGKLVRVARGRIFDVVADVRSASPTFRRWVGTELDSDGHRQLWIPAGFAHGFVVLGDDADVVYKTTSDYVPQSEIAIRWNDPDLAIAWPDPGAPFTLSDRDSTAPFLRDLPETRPTASACRDSPSSAAP